MKKLIVLLGFFLLMVGCEKESLPPTKFQGVWISNTLHLSDFEDSKVVLTIQQGFKNNEEQSIGILLMPSSVLIEVDSIYYQANDDNIVIHLTFVRANQYGNIKLFKSDSKMWELIGYANIRTHNCKSDYEYDRGEILYFNKD